MLLSSIWRRFESSGVLGVFEMVWALPEDGVGDGERWAVSWFLAFGPFFVFFLFFPCFCGFWVFGEDRDIRRVESDFGRSGRLDGVRWRGLWYAVCFWSSSRSYFARSRRIWLSSFA